MLVASVPETMQSAWFHGRWLTNLLVFILVGVNLFIFGLWCLESSDLPPPHWALPLPQQFLVGMAFMLLNPISLVTYTLFSTRSLLLSSKPGRGLAVAMAVVGVGFAVAGALWVPSPIVDWPVSILNIGDHTAPELLGELFPFHIVPAFGGAVDLASASGMHSLMRWQFEECAARFGVLISLWAAWLVTLWRIYRKPGTAQSH